MRLVARDNCINDNVSESKQAAPEEGERLEGNKVAEESNRTTFEDNVGSTKVVYGPDAATLLRGKTDPYPSDDMSNILTREYRLPSIIWNTSHAIGDPIGVMSFPEDLVDLSVFINDRLKNYMFFRSKLRLTFRINTTKFEYGSILISWLPYYNHTSSQACRHLTLTQCSQNNANILSANIGNTLTFDVPYISPLTYMAVADIGAAAHLGMLGSVFITCLTPLLSVSPNPPASVEISVFAKFLEPEVAGLQPLTTPDLSSPLMKNFKRRSARQIKPSLWTEAKPQSSSGKRAPAPRNAHEADKKVSSGSLIDVVESTVSSVLSVTDTAMGVMGALEKLGPLLGALGLGKPIMNTPNAFQNVEMGSDLVSSDGIDYCQQLTMGTGAQTAVDSNIIDGDSPQPGVYEMCRKPHYSNKFSFDNSANPDQILFTTRVHPLNLTGQIFTNGTKFIMSLGPINWYSSMYYFWRGSLKMLFYFNTSGFTTTRVRITHVPGVALSAVDLASYSGDLISKIVDITGDTTVEFTVPYLQQTQFVPVQYDFTGTTADFYNGTIMVSLVNPVNASDTTAASTVNCAIFTAAGEDFELMQFVGPRKPSGWITNLSKTLPMVDIDDDYIEARPQMNLGMVFKKPFDGLTTGQYTVQKGLFTIDPPGSIVSLGHRYVTYSGSDGATYPLPDLTTGHHALADSVLWYYNACHLFMRGSMRYKRRNLNGTTTSFGNAGLTSLVNGSKQPPQLDAGVTIPLTAGTSFVGFQKVFMANEIPYFGVIPFIEVIQTQTSDPSQFPMFNNAYPTGAGTNQFVAFGDDFSVGGLCAPPVYYFPVPLMGTRLEKLKSKS